MTFVSKIKDQNIFHIFVFDIIQYYDSKNIEAIIISNDLDINHSCQKWRLFVMNKIYDKVIYSNNSTLKDSIKTCNAYDWWQFIKYKPDNHLIKIYNKFLPKFRVKKDDKYILLNQRDLDNRYLYEYKTKLKLGEYLLTQKIKLPLKICNFSNMTPEEQYEICSKSAIFISAHGAGCTNLIFTPQNTPLIEINFRKHWYCDHVCDDHYNGLISINEKCDGKLNYRHYFHKADYHNLCYLINKKYIEIEAVEYGEGFTSRNPIGKKKIYIDGDKIVKLINSLLF